MADGDSPGWDAINAALEPIYKGREPLHYGTIISYQLGGPDPLNGISAYRRENPDHWHFVTFGFTELYGKESTDPAISGWGFELTFRLARTASEEKPPMWALNFLQNLARYVFDSGNPFGLGHHMPLNSPICMGAETAIWSIAFGREPELGEIAGKNGRAEFLQVVGITNDELDLIMEWNTEAFLSEFATTNPLLLTDLGRRSMLSDPVRAAAFRQRAAKEGSSMESSYLESGKFIEGRPVVWEIGAFYINSVLRALRGRTLHGRPYGLIGRDQRVHLKPEPADAFALEGSELTLWISPALAREMLATLRPQRGEYEWSSLPGFKIRVVPTEIKDDQGKVAEVIG